MLRAQEKLGSSDTRVRMESQIDVLMDKYSAVGLAVAVIHDRQLIYSNGFGIKNVETKSPLGPDDLFRIASISKSFSATSVMQLVEKGKISLDDEVSQLIGFEVQNPRHPTIKITLRMLLSHTSSLNDSQGYFSLDSINPETNREASKCYSEYAPGTEYRYCNLNFNMIGAIIERSSGERFDSYIESHILSPLGLAGGFNTNELQRDQLVPLYSLAKQTKNPIEQNAYPVAEDNYENYRLGYSTPRFSPTGGMKMSAKALALYMDMHLGLGQSNGIRIIDEVSARQMQAIDTEHGNYGLALMGKSNWIKGKSLVGHTGSAYGLYSAMFFAPEEDFGLVLITNGCEPTQIDGDIALLKEAANVLYEHLIASAEAIDSEL